MKKLNNGSLEKEKKGFNKEKSRSYGKNCLSEKR